MEKQMESLEMCKELLSRCVAFAPKNRGIRKVESVSISNQNNLVTIVFCEINRFDCEKSITYDLTDSYSNFYLEPTWTTEKITCMGLS